MRPGRIFMEAWMEIMTNWLFKLQLYASYRSHIGQMYFSIWKTCVLRAREGGVGWWMFDTGRLFLAVMPRRWIDAKPAKSRTRPLVRSTTENTFFFVEVFSVRHVTIYWHGCPLFVLICALFNSIVVLKIVLVLILFVFVLLVLVVFTSSSTRRLHIGLPAFLAHMILHLGS